MDSDFDADALANGLYEFRRHVLRHLTDEGSLPEYLATPLWESFSLVQAAIRELEHRHGCRDASINGGDYLPT